MRRARQTVFLERRSYRRRRMMDAARLLPILGAVLFLVPLIWPRANAGNGVEPTSGSTAFLYLFGLWAGLIIVSGCLSRYAGTWRDEDKASADTGDI